MMLEQIRRLSTICLEDDFAMAQSVVKRNRGFVVDRIASPQYREGPEARPWRISDHNGTVGHGQGVPDLDSDLGWKLQETGIHVSIAEVHQWHNDLFRLGQYNRAVIRRLSWLVQGDHSAGFGELYRLHEPDCKSILSASIQSTQDARTDLWE